MTEVGRTLLSPEHKTKGEILNLNQTLGRGDEKSITLPNGTSAVRNLSLKLGSYQDSTITRSVVLKLEFDGMQTVWCPIGDFFGNGIGLNPF